MGKLKPRSTPNLLQRAMEFANRVGRVTIDSVAVELACARSSAKNVLSRLEKTGDLVRLEPGVYMLKSLTGPGVCECCRGAATCFGEIGDGSPISRGCDECCSHDWSDCARGWCKPIGEVRCG